MKRTKKKPVTNKSLKKKLLAKRVPLCSAILLALLAAKGRAEEETILTSSVEVIGSFDTTWTPNPRLVLEKSFKNFVLTDFYVYDADGTVEIILNLGTEHSLSTAFYANRSWNPKAGVMGRH